MRNVLGIYGYCHSAYSDLASKAKMETARAKAGRWLGKGNAQAQEAARAIAQHDFNRNGEWAGKARSLPREKLTWVSAEPA